MTRITIFCPATIPQKSGAGINAFNLAIELVEQGHVVKIVCFQHGGQQFIEHRNGIEIIRIPIFYQNIFTKILSYITILPVFIISLVRSDASLVYGPIQGYLFLFLFSKLTRKKVLFRSTMFGTDDITSLLEKTWNVFKPVKKYLLSNMGTYISQSPAMTKSFKLEFGCTIPYLETAQGVNTKKFQPIINNKKNQLRQKLGITVQCTILVSVGYVIERKGLREIFKCLAKQHKKNFLYIVVGDFEPKSDHYLYGSKDEMMALYNFGTDMLGPKVLFTGSIENTEEYLQAADIFIINSIKEGMPNVLLEAMATGLPAIVRRLPGVDKYITFHNKNSLVIDTAKELEWAISTLFDMPEKCLVLGANACSFINEQFSLENVASKIVQECIKYE